MRRDGYGDGVDIGSVGPIGQGPLCNAEERPFWGHSTLRGAEPVAEEDFKEIQVIGTY
jgi:hypothetical protein